MGRTRRTIERQQPTRSDDEIRQRFMVVLNQRGGIDLDGFLRVLGYHGTVTKSGGIGQVPHRIVRRIDALCTEMLPDPRCRVESPRISSAGTELVANPVVRYCQCPPQEAFAPVAGGPPVKVTRDPSLATWTPDAAVQAKLAERERKAAMYGEHSQGRQSAAELRRHVVAVAAGGEKSVGADGVTPRRPSPSTTTGRGGSESETNSQEDAEMGKSRARCIDDFETALKMLPELADNRLNQAYVIESLAGLGNSWIYKNENEIYRTRLKQALQAEKARRARDFEAEAEPHPSPLLGKEREPEAEPEAADQPQREERSRLVRAMEQLQAENRELKERLAAVAEQPQPMPVTDPREVLASRLPVLRERVKEIEGAIADLERQREEAWAQIKSIEGCLQIL